MMEGTSGTSWGERLKFCCEELATFASLLLVAGEGETEGLV